MLLNKYPEQLLYVANQTLPAGDLETVDEFSALENKNLKVFSLG